MDNITQRFVEVMIPILEQESGMVWGPKAVGRIVRWTLKASKTEIVPELKQGGGEIFMARAMRLTVVQQQYDAGNLTEAEARELLAGPLNPDDESTRVDDKEG